jgi:Cu-Zn family superoxide dismutase
MKLTVLFATLILLFCLAGCSKAKTATAEIHDAQGNMVGTATLTEVADGVKISLDASNLPPGLHGIHVHSVGKCEPPDFASASAHFNPDGRHHGTKNPLEPHPHLGDLPNITVGSDGRIKTDMVLHNVTLGEDPEKSLLRQGGTALVIHVAADDDTTDPSGNSGARIACGVIKAK